MSYRKRSIAVYLWRQQIWVSALLVAAGLVLGAIKVSTYQTASQFAEDGVKVIGEVTRMTDYSSSSRKTYRVSYTFATPADPYNNGIQGVSERFYETQTVGAPIAVWYLPTDPTSNVVDLEKLSSWFGLSMAIAAGVTLAGAIGAGISISRARVCIGLRENGETQIATVTHHVVEGKKKLKGHFRWRHADGREGRSLTAPLASLPAVGSVVTLFGDPAQRLKPVWEGDIGSR
tara:strand:+ start:87 stop:782 length:696 start_codon:yes stop_codon:yes gene_type:complete